MLENKCSTFIVKLRDWYDHHCQASEAEDVLGAPHLKLCRFLYDNRLADSAGEPEDGVSFQHVLDCVLLWVAMRKELKV